MNTTNGLKQRKAKVNKAQTYNGRRRADRARRAQRRARTEQRQRERRQYKFRIKVVRYYRRLREQVSAKRAIELTLARWQPIEPWHFPLSVSSIRQWDRLARREGLQALYPKSRQPHTIHYQVSEVVVGIIFTLRRLFGWGGHRIAAELKARGIGQVSGRTVYKLFDRLGLPVKVYALKGRSDGIAYQPYEKDRPNAQWHIDLKHTTLSDGSKVYICILIDDYSRYALAAVAGISATTEWVAQVAQGVFLRCGRPEEIVSDNGREFVSVWEDTLTKFGQLLAEYGVEHVKCAPYYPQGNGKAEAFIKTLNRELLNGRTFDTLEELQTALDRYLLYYNNYRRHSALGWQTPVSRYIGWSDVSGAGESPR
ncbi:MAG: DDE-type integrase/transposase/recombinase [Anaerolineae bacterium]|jgi:transposase InsO family protein|nr:DDE-type integrase/transposase/recombinase [Anaerolineae bacterium]